jgi:hypothetical protein
MSDERDGRESCAEQNRRRADERAQTVHGILQTVFHSAATLSQPAFHVTKKMRGWLLCHKNFDRSAHIPMML